MTIGFFAHEMVKPVEQHACSCRDTTTRHEVMQTSARRSVDAARSTSQHWQQLRTGKSASRPVEGVATARNGVFVQTKLS